MSDPSQALHRSFGLWKPPATDPAAAGMWLPPGSDDPMLFLTPRAVFAGAGGAKHGRTKWKGKKTAGDMRKPPVGGSVAAGGGGYRPPTLTELQYQNRVKARRFYPNKKKYQRSAPFAPRNTSSFLMRAKKDGGITSLVSPCPVTPAILPTPKFSPSREGLVDMAKEEWGVDGYGSMNGLIRLRSPGNEMRGGEEEEEAEAEEGSSESDVEEHVEVERRLDHDLSRFEMVYRPNYGEDHGGGVGSLLENRVDGQDAHIARLEEENLTLKERLFLMESEMGELKRRLQALETGCRVREDENDAHMNEAASDNEGGGDVSSDKNTGD